MWIKTSQGLINSDKFGRFFVATCSWAEENHTLPFVIVARPADIPHDLESSTREPLDEIEKKLFFGDYTTETKFEWFYDDSQNYDFDTVVEYFDTEDDAKKYLDKLAEKLGALRLKR